MKVIECPRDAMQGIHEFIPTELKARYINTLIKVGFDTIDFGSFVSPKAIPQLKDTAAVLNKLELNDTKLLAIVANERGAQDASNFEEIEYLGYPFSISETFQKRNTNRGIDAAWNDVQKIQNTCLTHKKQLVVYFSMGFGNPYNDEWNVGIVEKWAEKFNEIGVKIISLADTVGAAQPDDIAYLFTELSAKYPQIEFGAHFHSRPLKWKEKIDAAYQSGCRRFDSTIKGIGGCPFAKDELVGNIATENLLMYLNNHDQPTGINAEAFGEAVLISTKVFSYL
ncbi:hydroxymethylglutaryl-CoA lyase [bacterium]|nr:hydroxymethylglutaryl-CoA lyase [bacterium]